MRLPPRPTFRRRARAVASVCALFAIASCASSRTDTPAAAPPQPVAHATAAASVAPPPSASLAAQDTPAASTIASVPAPASDWWRRLTRLYNAYARGPKARDEEYRKLFAPRLRRFITLRDVPLDTAIRAAETFFKDKNQVTYRLVGNPSLAPTATGTHLTALVDASWTTALPAEWADELQDKGEDWNDVVLGYEKVLAVELDADAAGKVVSYVETAGPPKRFRVHGDENPTLAFDFPHSQCEQDYDQLSSEALPKGAVVESAGQFVQFGFCGPGPQIVHKIRFGGNVYWVLERSYSRTFDNQGNPHTGMVDYLELVE